MNATVILNASPLSYNIILPWSMGHYQPWQLLWLVVYSLTIRDGVFEDWPRPRGHLEDKILWPWPWPWRHDHWRGAMMLDTMCTDVDYSSLFCLWCTFSCLFSSTTYDLWSLTNHVGFHRRTWLWSKMIWPFASTMASSNTSLLTIAHYIAPNMTCLCFLAGSLELSIDWWQWLVNTTAR